MKTTEEILIEKGFTCSPNVFFSSFDGKHYEEFKRWNCNLTKPKKSLPRYEGIEANDFGFSILISHGKLCDFDLIKFPKYATESDFNLSFERLMNFINDNYEWEGGLSPYSNSWD